jgi:hypothetical protein
MQSAAWMRTLLLAGVLVPPLALAPATVHAQPKGPKTATKSEEAAAKKATAFFLKGSDLYKLKKYALALEQFKQSYAAVASPNSHLYIARCMAALGDTRAAYIEFTKVVEEASARAATEEKYAPTRDAAKEDRDELLSKIALVTVSVPQAGPNSSVRLGSEIIPREQWDKPIPVSPGTVEATLQVEGRPDVTQTLTLAGGEKKSVVLNAPGIDTPPPPVDPKAAVEPPPSTPSSQQGPLRPAAFIAGSVGVVGMGLFTVAGVLTLNTFAELTDKCGEKTACPREFEDEVKSGKTTQTLANVGLVVGAVGLATGATLFILSLRKDKTEGAPDIRVIASPGYAGIRGAF